MSRVSHREAGFPGFGAVEFPPQIRLGVSIGSAPTAAAFNELSTGKPGYDVSGLEDDGIKFLPVHTSRLFPQFRLGVYADALQGVTATTYDVSPDHYTFRSRGPSRTTSSAHMIVDQDFQHRKGLEAGLAVSAGRIAASIMLSTAATFINQRMGRDVVPGIDTKLFGQHVTLLPALLYAGLRRVCLVSSRARAAGYTVHERPSIDNE